MRKQGTKGLSHADLAARRAGMAAAVRSGASVAEVARRFKVKEQTVGNACAQHGLDLAQRRKQKDAARHQAIAQAARDGFTVREIAKRLGLSWFTIRDICIRAGVRPTPEPRAYPRSARTARVIQACRKAGVSFNEVARRFKLSASRVRYVYLRAIKDEGAAAGLARRSPDRVRSVR